MGDSIVTEVDNRTAVEPRSDDAVARVPEYAKAREVLGDRLASVIASGERNPSWEDVRQQVLAANGALRRLRDAVEIAESLLEVEGVETVRAWFAGKNPLLGDRAPALVLNEDPSAVRRAARHILAYG